MKLAIDGGKPVRDTMLITGYPGASYYDEKEAKEVFEVCMAKSPFRYYGHNVLGKADSFEENFAKRFGIKNVLGVSSGTAAVIVALKAAGIGPGDKVIVPACTYLATAGAVVCAGAVPVFADVDDSLSIDPEKIGDVVDPYTKAIITVPLLGNPCQMDAILEQAKKYNLIVIEDAAQSMGSSLNGKPMGTWGDMGAFSLQLNKIITTGEGGVVVCHNDTLYERAVRYHDQGQYRKQEGVLTNDPSRVLVGQNYRMSEITAAAALIQLQKLDDIIKKMREIKSTIKSSIGNIPGLSFRRIIDEKGDAASAIVMFLPNKAIADRFVKAMLAENIACGAQYAGRPVYMIPQIFHKKTIDPSGFPFNQFDEEIVYTEDMCPNAIELMPRSASIFLEPAMSNRDVDDVINAIKKVANAIL